MVPTPSCSTARDADNRFSLVQLRSLLGETHFHLGNYQHAKEILELSLASYQSLGSERGVTSTTFLLATVAMRSNEWREARIRLEETLLRARASSPSLVPVALGALAVTHARLGHFEEARSSVSEGKHLLHGLTSQVRVAIFKARSALVFALCGEHAISRAQILGHPLVP